MKIIKDLCKIFDCDDKKILYNGFDNTITELDNQIEEALNDTKGVYFNEYFTEVFCEYDIEDIKLKANNMLSHAIISLTDDCNLRCKYCGYHDTRYKNSNSLKDIDEITLKKALDFIIDHSVDAYETGISFYGGEPLLRFDLIKFAIKYLEDRNYHGHKYSYNVTTNCTLLNSEVIDYFVEKNILCAISLDGPIFIHDRYRVYEDGNPTHIDIMKNLKRIAKKSPKYYEEKIIFQAVVSPPYEYHIPKDYFGKKEVRFIDVSIGDYFSELLKNEYGLDLSGFEIKKENELMLMKMSDMSKDELIKNINYIGSLEKYMGIGEKDIRSSIFPSGFCIPLVTRIFIGTTGRIGLCERVDEDNQHFQLGDIIAGYDFDRINLLYKHTSAILAEHCNKCWAFRFCRACYKNLDMIKFDGDFCNLIRCEIEQDIKTFLEFKRGNKRFKEIMQSISID